MGFIRMEVTPLPHNRRPRERVEGPTPEIAHLEMGHSYPVIDLCKNCESPDGEAYLVVVSDLGEVWFVSNRYLQVTALVTSDGQHYMYETPVDD